MDEFLQDEEKMQILEVWKVFDKKGENQVNAADLPTIFQALNCNVTKAEVQEFLQYLDPNGEGIVRYADFLQVAARRLPGKETVAQLLNAFKTFDKENRGTIAPEELRHILSTFGEVMDAAEIDEYLAEADAKCPDLRANGEKTGLINYFAFVGEILDIPQSETIASAAAATT